MYPKNSSSLINQQFWTIFGKYMLPVLSAEGEKINWINYKTGIKFTRFIIQQIGTNVIVAIELYYPDITLQQQKWQQILQFKKQFEAICGNDWHWQQAVVMQQGNTISQVIATLANKNILNQDDWPDIISFLKPRLITLDEFWSNYKFALE